MSVILIQLFEKNVFVLNCGQGIQTEARKRVTREKKEVNEGKWTNKFDKLRRWNRKFNLIPIYSLLDVQELFRKEKRKKVVYFSMQKLSMWVTWCESAHFRSNLRENTWKKCFVSIVQEKIKIICDHKRGIVYIHLSKYFIWFLHIKQHWMMFD